MKIIKKNPRIFWLDQNMKNDVNSQEMFCNKISENPRFFFEFSAAFLVELRSMEKKNCFGF